MRTVVVIIIIAGVILVDLFWWCQCRINNERGTRKLIEEQFLKVKDKRQ